MVGRDQPVRLFAPQANTPASPDADALRARFSEALATYRAGQFNQALALFDAMADRDAIAAAFAERLRGWIANGPPQPWDGITNLESK